MQKTVLSFGETLWDLLPTGAKLGGAPFNFAYRDNCYSFDTVTASLERADVLKLNDDEAAQLAQMLELRNTCIDTVIEELVGRYQLACCVVTLGARGAFAISADGAKVYIPGYEIELVDSLGSGDAFTAGFIHKYLRGASLGQCCRYGNAMGAIVATQQGGTAPVSENDVSDFMSSDRRRIFEPAMLEFVIE